MNENETKHTFDRNESASMDDFLSRVINQVEEMVSEINSKNEELAKKDEEIAKRDKRIEELLQELEQAKQGRNVSSRNEVKEVLERAIVLAEQHSKKMEANAKLTASTIIEEAKRNADRIVNESLLRAEKVEVEANMLRRNIRLFKSRVKQLVDTELQIMEDMDKANF